MRSSPSHVAALVGALLALLLTSPERVHAQREHTVREGQSLARIARRYHVDVGNLAAANGMRRTAAIRPGQVLRVPEAGTHYVTAGDTLASVARDHEVSVAELTRLNRLRESRPLRIGQRLLLPGHAAAATEEAAASRWGRPRNPGVATLHRQSPTRRLRVRLVDRRGRARSAARERLRELMRPRPRRSTRRTRSRRVGD